MTILVCQLAERSVSSCEKRPNSQQCLAENCSWLITTEKLAELSKIDEKIKEEHRRWKTYQS